jgi:cell division protein FtsB
MTARAQAARGYRMRPAPRRRRGSGRGSRTRIQWDRLGRVLLVLVFFLVLAWYVNPVVNFVDAWRDSRAERTNLTELKAENAELRERAAGLEGPDAEERAARRLGLVAEGERSFVIRGLSK